MTGAEAQAAIEAMVVAPHHAFDDHELEALEVAIAMLQWADRRPGPTRLYRLWGDEGDRPAPSTHPSPHDAGEGK